MNTTKYTLLPLSIFLLCHLSIYAGEYYLTGQYILVNNKLKVHNIELEKDDIEITDQLKAEEISEFIKNELKIDKDKITTNRLTFEISLDDSCFIHRIKPLGELKANIFYEINDDFYKYIKFEPFQPYDKVFVDISLNEQRQSNYQNVENTNKKHLAGIYASIALSIIITLFTIAIKKTA